MYHRKKKKSQQSTTRDSCTEKARIFPTHPKLISATISTAQAGDANPKTGKSPHETSRLRGAMELQVFRIFKKKKGQKVVNFLHVRLISRWSIIYVYIYIYVCMYIYIYYIYIICNHIYFNISIRYLKNRCILFLSKNQICRMQIFFSKLAWLACQVRSANGMESMAELRVLHLRDFWNLFCWQVSRKNHWQKKWKLGINRVWDF